MGHWKTDKFVEEIGKMDLVQEVKTKMPGGDYDSAGLVVKVKGASDRLYISGYASTEEICEELGVTWDDIPNCEFVTLGDGMDSRGGLNSTNENLGIVFVRLRKYFKKLGFTVVNHYNEIF